MNLAKISANSQITVPVEIRRLLGLKSGDKILFFQKQDGEVIISNASAKAMGSTNEGDIQELVDEICHKKDK